MIKYLAIGAGVLILALGAACYFLYDRTETLAKRTGALETSNKQLTEAVNAKTKATQSRANAERDTRQLAPADKLERMR